MVGKGLRAQRLPAKVGVTTMIGRTVTALTPVGCSGGTVLIDGEHWQAVSDLPMVKGDTAGIASVDGLTLHIQRQPAGPLKQPT